MLLNVTLPVLVLVSAVIHFAWRLLRNYALPRPFPHLAGPPSGSIWAGNMKQIAQRNAWGFLDDLVHTYGPVSKIHGFFGATWLHVYDPKVLYHIFVKDQDRFYKGKLTDTSGRLIVGPSLLFTEGPAHRKQRKALSPVFSGAHMRSLAPVFWGIANKLETALKLRVGNEPREIDVLEWMGRTALELVGQGGLGHSFDPLTADTQDGFTQAVKSFSASITQIQHFRVFLPFLVRLGPAWFRRFLLDILPNARVQRVKKIMDVAHAGCREIFEKRKAALLRGDQEVMYTVGEGKDVMSVLLKGNALAPEEDRIPEDELLAQMITFVIAGVDTTSNSISRVLYILCDLPDVQSKLRAEIRQAQEQHGKEVPYDEIMALPLLDAVCRETLRLYSPVTINFRENLEDVVLPLHEPIRGTHGHDISEIVVPKGTSFVCNLRACNTNKAIWGEDADEWKPERWLQPLPKTVEDARIPGIYSHLMTFLSGSHACIGFKFSQLEMKIVIATLLSNFKFERASTPIVWNFAGIAFPAKNEDSSQPEMYLKVSLAA